MADVQSIIDDAVSTANDATIDALSKINDAVGKVEGAVGSANMSFTTIYSLGIVDEITDFLHNIQSGVKFDVTKDINIGNLGNISIPDFNPIDITPIKDKVNDLFNIIDSIPSRINQAMDIIDLITGKISADLLNGGYGIDEVDESALWDRSRDRELFIANLKFGKLKSEHTGMGLPIPQGIFIKNLSEVIDDTQKSLDNLERDISIKRADLYRVAREFAIEKGIEIGKENFAITSLKVQMFKDNVSLLSDALKLEIENHKERLAKSTLELDKMFKEQNILIDEYKTDILKWNDRIVDIIQAAGVSSQLATSKVEQARLQIQAENAQNNIKVQEFQAKTQAYIAAMDADANVLSNKVSGYLSGINVLASKIEEVSSGG